MGYGVCVYVSAGPCRGGVIVVMFGALASFEKEQQKEQSEAGRMANVFPLRRGALFSSCLNADDCAGIELGHRARERERKFGALDGQRRVCN
jgi:hypothetical protein